MIRSLLSRLFGRGGSADPDGGGTVDGSDPEPDDVDEEAEEDSNDVWDLIPSWEYDGKYVQSGGHTRGEQERALRNIQRQAEEIERSEEETEPHPDS